MAADDGTAPVVPRSRLSSSSMRRAAPVRPVRPAAPAPVSVSPQPVAAAGAVPRRRLVALAVGAALLVSAGGATLLWSAAGDRGSARLTAVAAVDVGHPAPPVSLGTDSEVVDTEVLDGGDLLVSHWVRTTAPMDRLTLEVPPGSGLSEEGVDVDGLTVVADGVDVGPPQPGGPGWAGALPAARDLYLQYRLSGVAQSSGSVDGRALVTLTALTLGVGGEPLARTQVFSGAEVLTLACLAPGARSTPALCGTLVNDTWTLRSSPGAAPGTVIAQLDLAPGVADR